MIIITLVFFVACTSKEQKALMQTYEKEKDYHMKLQKTEKTQLYDGQVTKAMLTATYLFEQSTDKNDTHDEVFIVGLFIEEDEAFDPVSFGEDEYILVLRDKPKKKSKSKKDKTKKEKVKKDESKKGKDEKAKDEKSDTLPKSIKELKAGDPLLKDISFKSEWSKFYLVTFPHTKKRNFKLVFESYFYGNGELNFAKVSKFVLTGQAF